MRIVVTGGDGFVGRNLRVRLGELGHGDVTSLTRATPAAERDRALAQADVVFHLAGVNRPKDPGEFDEGNAKLTATVCAALAAAGREATLVITSSTQAALDNPYGKSKRAAEQEVERYGKATGAPAVVLRLTNIFGKWCRPNYNSAVATFCHNIARGLPIAVNDPAAPLKLVYIDDVVEALVRLVDPAAARAGAPQVGPVYETTVGAIADLIRACAGTRTTLNVPRVGAGLDRAIYSTYVSYLPPEAFAYDLTKHADPRGVFAEMLRTADSGQFSYFTAGPGITRGEHYHHTKTEKFLVVLGKARFGFRHLVTGEVRELIVEGGAGRVVDTVPGWVHNITNVGEGEMIVLLWANEAFDPNKPDTVPAKVAS